MSSGKSAENEYFWSRFAETFESGSEYVVGQEVIDAIHAAILRQVDLGHTLELACGNGTYTQSLAQVSSHVTATDLSVEMLAIAHKKLAHLDNISFGCKNCLDISYQSNSFDTVFMANLIHVISDPLRVLHESRRLLKPGGRLIITSFTSEGMTLINKITLIYRYLKTWGKPPKEAQSFSLSELSTQLTSLGFSINESFLLGRTMKALFIAAEKSQ